MPALHAPFIQSRITAFQALFTEATVSRPLILAKDSIAAHQRILRLPFIRFTYKAATGKAADLARVFNSKLLEAKAASAKGLLALRNQLVKTVDVPNAESLAQKALVIVGTMPSTAAAEHELIPPGSFIPSQTSTQTISQLQGPLHQYSAQTHAAQSPPHPTPPGSNGLGVHNSADHFPAESLLPAAPTPLAATTLRER